MKCFSGFIVPFLLFASWPPGPLAVPVAAWRLVGRMDAGAASAGACLWSLLPPHSAVCSFMRSRGRWLCAGAAGKREEPHEEVEQFALFLVRYPACICLFKPKLQLSVSVGEEKLLECRSRNRQHLSWEPGLHRSCGMFVPTEESPLFEVQHSFFFPFLSFLFSLSFFSFFVLFF